MATKTSITSTINGFITAIVTVTKVRNAFDTLLNNIYPTPILDTQATTNVATSLSANFEYSLQFTKTARNIHIYGTIQNVSGSILGGVEDVLEITTAEFDPYTTYTLIGSNSNCNVEFSLNVDALTLVSSIGVDEIVVINQTYQSLN